MKPRKKTEKAKKKKKEQQQDALDSALQDSFPASDPVSLTEPGSKSEPKIDRTPPRREAPEHAPGP